MQINALTGCVIYLIKMIKKMQTINWMKKKTMKKNLPKKV